MPGAITKPILLILADAQTAKFACWTSPNLAQKPHSPLVFVNLVHAVCHARTACRKYENSNAAGIERIALTEAFSFV
jgi:hypothetical protein